MDATVWTSAIIAAVIAILALPHPGEPAVAYAIGPGKFNLSKGPLHARQRR
jgi:hypothetical protein